MPHARRASASPRHLPDSAAIRFAAAHGGHFRAIWRRFCPDQRCCTCTHHNCVDLSPSKRGSLGPGVRAETRQRSAPYVASEAAVPQTAVILAAIMHYGSILLNFAARSPSRADAENGVLRDANGPDRSGHSGTERGITSVWPRRTAILRARAPFETPSRSVSGIRLCSRWQGGDDECARWARAVGLDRIRALSQATKLTMASTTFRVVAVPVDDADNLAQAETSVLDALDPPLILRGRPPSAIRTRVAHLRAMAAQLASWSRRRERMRSRAGLSDRAAHH